MGSSDTVSIGILDNPAEYGPLNQQTFAGTSSVTGIGEIWMTLNQLGAYAVFAKGDDELPHLLGGGQLQTPQTFDNTAWRALFVSWDDRTNTVTASIDGTKVVNNVSVAPFYNTIPTTGAMGFEFTGTAAIDNFSAVPEPASLATAIMGGVGFALLAWRRRRSAGSS